MITQARLKELFHYDPETGVFVRLVTRGGQSKGAVAGGPGSQGYFRIKVDGEFYQAHRLAWLYMHGKFPSEQIDHKNHNRRDNRQANLREASRQENCRNQTLYANNKSGVTGVAWYPAINKWRAQIKINGTKIHLGYFTKKSDAIKARKAANINHNFHPNHGVNL